MSKAWPLLLLTLSCQFDPRLPSSSSVTCGVADVCPQALVCQRPARVCVEADRLDEVAPTITSSELTLEPLEANRVRNPTALGPSVVARVRFSVSEGLSMLPTVSAIHEGHVDDRVSCTLSRVAPPNYEAGCEVLAGASGDDVELRWRVSLVDLALQEASLALPESTWLDLTAPPAPRVSDGGAWLRDSPWGDETTEFRPRVELQAAPGIAVDAVSVAFRQGSTELGTTLLDAGTWGSLTVLSALNEVAPEVVALDRAGNESAWTRIDEVRWIASFVGKVAGLSYPNPHRFEVVRADAEGLEGFAVTERSAADGIDRPRGASVEVQGAATWRRQVFGSPESRTGYPAAVYDAVRSRVVRFGGSTGEPGSLPRALVAWTGVDWQTLVPTDPEGDGDPSGRLAPQLAWDPHLGGVVLHGGLFGVPFADTWLWNGRSWRRLPDAPVGRYGGTLYFDAATQRLITTAGLDRNAQPLNDAWALTDEGWIAVAPPPYLPRLLPSVASDPSSGVTYLFGGSSTDDHVWMLRDGVWSQGPSGGPGIRAGAAATYDPHRERFVISGGTRGNDTTLSDVWEFAPQTSLWAETTPVTAVGPGARAGHVLVADWARHDVILFGQQGDGGVVLDADNDTWRYQPRGWELASRPLAAPHKIISNTLLPTAGARLRAIGLDAQSRVVDVRVDTSGWTQSLTTQTGDLVGHLAIDSLTGTAHALGLAGSTANFAAERADGGWEHVADLPTLLSAHVLGWVPTASGFDVLSLSDAGVGLRALSRTGALGPLQLLPQPTELGIGARAGDAGTVVLGSTTLATPLQLLFPSDPSRPPAQLDSVGVAVGLVWHEARRTLVVPGVAKALPPQPHADDVWEFRDAAWARMPVVDTSGGALPSFVTSPSVGYSSGRESLLVIERRTTLEPEALWELQMTQHRPHAVLRFLTGSLPRDLELRGATLRLSAGGSSGDEGGVPGVTASLRAAGWWTDPLPITAALATAPATVETSLSPDALAELSRGLARAGEVAIRLQPAGANGSGWARLTVDAPVLELRFRR